MFNNVQGVDGQYDLQLERVDDTGKHVFLHSGVMVEGGATHLASYETWDGHGSLELDVDQNSDGVVDATVILKNEVKEHRNLPLVMR